MDGAVDERLFMWVFRLSPWKESNRHRLHKRAMVWKMDDAVGERLTTPGSYKWGDGADGGEIGVQKTFFFQYKYKYKYKYKPQCKLWMICFKMHLFCFSSMRILQGPDVKNWHWCAPRRHCWETESCHFLKYQYSSFLEGTWYVYLYHL